MTQVYYHGYNYPRDSICIDKQVTDGTLYAVKAACTVQAHYKPVQEEVWIGEGENSVEEILEGSSIEGIVDGSNYRVKTTLPTNMKISDITSLKVTISSENGDQSVTNTLNELGHYIRGTEQENLPAEGKTFTNTNDVAKTYTSVENLNVINSPFATWRNAPHEGFEDATTPGEFRAWDFGTTWFGNLSTETVDSFKITAEFEYQGKKYTITE